MKKGLLFALLCFFPFFGESAENAGLIDANLSLLGIDAQLADQFPVFTIILKAYYTLASSFGTAGFCWLCPFFIRFYQVMTAASWFVASTLQGWVMKLMIVGVLFALALKVLQIYAGLKEIKPKDALKELLPFLGKALLALILISQLSFVVSALLNPFLNIFVGLGQQLQAEQLKNMTGDYFIINNAFSVCNETTCTFTGSSFSFDAKYFMSESLCRVILKMICLVNGTMVLGIAIGVTFISCALRYTVNGNGVDLSSLFLGLALCFYYFLLMVQYPFRFFEVVLRLGFIFALLPFLLICWVFKATKDYFKQGWGMFLNACVSLFFLMLISLWVIELVNFSFGGTSGQKDLIQLLVSGKDAEALALFKSEDTGFLTTFLVLQTAMALLGVVDKLTGFLTDTSVPELVSRSTEGKMVAYGQQMGEAIRSLPIPGAGGKK